MSGSAPPLLTATGLTWEAGGQRIVDHLDLVLPEGGCTAVIGPNGAGKTSLLRLLTGLLAPTAGSVAWRGRPLARLSSRERARHIAYVPQVRPARVPLRVTEVVALGRYAHHARWQLGQRPGDGAVVRAALARVGLHGFDDRPLDTLSGGERQAVYLAAALAQAAPLLVLDEPTTHLDAHHQRAVARLLAELRATGEHTLLFSTHDLQLAGAVADRVLALAAGRVLADGPPAEVLEPGLLEELFAAPFVLLAGGPRPRVGLDLGI